MNEFLSDFVKESGNEYANIVSEGLDGSDIHGFVDTGSYAFNALLSGSLWGGIPNNKIVALAGESATGKTYFTLGIVYKFLVDNSDGVVLYFDTEQAITSEMFEERGIDPKRVAVFPIAMLLSPSLTLAASADCPIAILSQLSVAALKALFPIAILHAPPFPAIASKEAFPTAMFASVA